MNRTVSIAGRKIGPDYEPYVVCELSANHNGSLDRAIAIMDAAKAAGADAIKLQTYRADTITIDHDGPEFLLKEGLWAGRRLYELYQSAAMPWEWHEPLFKRAQEVGIAIFNYAANNSGQTPNFSTRHEYPVDLPDDGSNSGPGWVVLLERYIGQKPDGAIWSCPAWPDDQRRINYFIAAKWMWRGQSPGQRSIQLSKIRTASEFVLSGDCTAQEYYPPPYGNPYAPTAGGGADNNT